VERSQPERRGGLVIFHMTDYFWKASSYQHQRCSTDAYCCIQQQNELNQGSENNHHHPNTNANYKTAKVADQIRCILFQIIALNKLFTMVNPNVFKP
jgi:hypothetical protein